MKGGNILLVEDDATLAEQLEWNLTSGGFSVRSTPDGDKALLMVHEQRPDLVVLDWMIEGTSGIEVCRRLRKAIDLPGTTDPVRTVRSAGYALTR